MIRKLYTLESPGFDPYENLAIEEALLEQVPDCAILYLWQNEHTVVIGKNQNPWKECAAALLAQEGGHLARRLSGGGAVFHDLGNLNFTLLLPQTDFDIQKQLTVVEKAMQSLGLPAQRSGRNDVLVQGRKFSGNAFYKNGKAAYHHGTLLVCADLQRLGRYLTPSRLKLQSKGVESVTSRVANLQEFSPELTLSQVKQALIQAFSRVYGLPVERLAVPDRALLERLENRYASDGWIYGTRYPFSCTLEGRFLWGGVEVCLEVRENRVTRARVYTDAMEDSWVETLEQRLTLCPFERAALKAAAGDASDIASLFSQI